MDKRKMSKISAALAVLVVLAIAFLMQGGLRRTAHIVLPEDDIVTEQPPDENGASGGGIAVVEINPKTVQTAIATLARPTAYRRNVTVEQFWSGGSGSFDTMVAVSGALTRTDRTLPSGRIRHAITDGVTTYIWYDSEESVFTAPAGGISADEEQSIPTYEEILELPVAVIAEADYQAYQDVNCIFTQTTPDEDGYVLRYWVSVDTGLLTAAERLLDDQVIYRMTSLSADLVQPENLEFTLPNGTDLLGPG